MKIKRLIFILVVFSVFFSFFYCASLGPKYQVPAKIEKGKALIVFYRPWRFRSGPDVYDLIDITGVIAEKKANLGRWEEYIIVDDVKAARANGINLCTVYNGGYFSYLVDPGKHYFFVQSSMHWARGDIVTAIDAKEREIYYVESGVWETWGPYLKNASKQESEKAAVECKLIPSNK